ncbi:hypothetical protein CIK05_12665 [Bdellovibrio sp. qaytius]|nr:hypothetical protein CIK05_12665 [Bdellovibrio sp. qaytius]
MCAKIYAHVTLNMIGQKIHRLKKVICMNNLREKHPFLHKISVLMDSKYEFFGISFGFDFIIGLLPFWGNLTTTAISLFTVVYSAFHGVSVIVLLRMLLNISVDMVITAIPVFGNLADVFWKANAKNYKILDNYLQNPGRTVKRSLFANLAILGTYLAIIAGCFYGLYRLTVYVISLF